MVFILVNQFLNLIRAHFYDKKIGEEVDGADLGDEFAGYVFRIQGGMDK